MLNKFTSLYQVTQVNYLFWRKEFRSKIKVSIHERISMLRMGFHGESKIIYQLNKNNYRDYLPDYKRLKSKFINEKHSFVLNDKIIFERLLNGSIRIPESFALIIKGEIVPLGESIVDIDTLIEYVLQRNYCVIKPISGGGGAGVIILEMANDELYSNNKPITINELSKKIAQLDGCFISEFIQQGKFADQFNPSTLNSMRIVTMIDPDTNEAFIPIAVQRIGTKKSAPADNWTQGGISAEIDVKTGVIGKGISYPIDGKLTWHEKHPDTNADIEGVKIPNWDNVKNLILNVVNKHPYIKYVGWDVVLTDDGVMVIEGNNCTDVNLLQIHTPLLKNERAKRFYQYHDVI